LPIRRHRRQLALVAVLATAAAVAWTASPGSARHRTLPPGPWCGGPLWRLMNFADADRNRVDTTPVATSIQNISQLTPPAEIGLRRTTSFQRHAWKLDVVIDRYRIGSDGEIALVLYSIPTAQYMNAYLANPHCLAPGSRERARITAARQEFKTHCPPVTASWQLLGASAELTGIGFWNPLRNTRGALPNGAELRPVVDLQIVTGC
jgi:hypothetical protein